ncbi:SPOSA6832_00142, partial [Sporobolomyces salmonicolor]
MGRTATLHFVSLRSCLVNLPLSIHGPLVQRGVAPQTTAVKLSYKSSPSSSPTTFFTGWTGLPASVAPVSAHARGAAAAQDRVEMDPQFAAMLNIGLTEGMTVSIELLRDLPSASSVNVTPLSADDWEILETNAEFVEMYLLNQVRSVKDGMVVGCWVGGTTLVRFVVDSTDPPASPALLLTSSTELIVAPKSRHAPPPVASKTHDLSHPSSSPPPAVHTAEWDSLRRKLLRLLPLELEASVVAGSLDDAPDVPHRGDEIYLSPSLYRSVRRIFPASKLNLAHHPRPKSSATNDGPAPPPTTDEAASGSGAGKGKEERRGSMGVEVRLRDSAKVPAGHAWIGERVRRELGIKGDRGGFELLNNRPSLHQKSSLLNGHSAIVTPTTLTNGASSCPSGTSTSSPTPARLAGVDAQLSSLKSHIINSLAARKFAGAATGASALSGVLVTGASGAGKTALVNEMARAMEVDERALTHTIYIDCAKHADDRHPTLKGRMQDWFDEACWHAPTLLVLDNLDRMLSAEVEHADSFPSLHLAHTFLSIAQSALSSRPVILVATAQGSTSLHPLLTATHLLGETVALKGPGKGGRKDILNSLIQAKTASSDLTATNLNCASIAAITEGYLPADLRDLVDRAVHQAAIRMMGASSSAPLTLTANDFLTAQTGFVPLSLRDVKLQKSEVQWADIGGLHETRKTLRETLEWPTKYGAIFATCPLRLRSGCVVMLIPPIVCRSRETDPGDGWNRLLLYGFPGCGKTLLASAVAKECGLNFISVKGPEILNKYIGASEKSVRDLFERAQAAKPCVLFFDEFDSIAPKRGHDSTGVTDRVVNQMLTQMDGAEGLDGVYVLAATSRPDLIDPALLRPGRLDKSLLCDMPSESDRLEIMQACARKVHLSPSVSLPHYASLTAGYSGADLQALIYNAHLDAIHAALNAAEGIEDEKNGKGGGEEEVKYVSIGGNKDEKVLSRAEQANVNKRLELILSAMKESSRSAKAKKTATSAASPSSRVPTVVEDRHLQKSLQTTRPSVPAEELVRLRRIYSEFVSKRSPGGLPSGEASDEVGGRASLM